MNQANLLTKIRTDWRLKKNRSQNPLQKENHRGKKIPRKVAAGKKVSRKKNRQAKAALDREVKREREIAEKEQENENSPGWLPEMSFQTVLSIVGMAFTAFELYQRFRQKDSSGGGINTGGNSVQSPISSITAEPRAEPREDFRPERSGVPSVAERRPKTGMA